MARDLKVETETLERLRRETSARAEKDRGHINQLKDELAKAKTKMDEYRIRSEEEHNRLDLQLSSLNEEKNNCLKEIEALKVQLRVCEDRGDSLNNGLQETTRKLKESMFFITVAIQM